jgi:hypothetical protein
MVMLVALMGSALYLVLRIGQVRSLLMAKDGDMAGAARKEVAAVDRTLWEETLEQLNHPYHSHTYSNQMMVSQLRVACVNAQCGRPIPFYAEICPFCGAEQPEFIPPEEADRDSDGIPDNVEIAMGLNPHDKEDAYDDADEDGFSNIEEYQWGTDMTNPEEYPSPAAKLRVVKVLERPFKFRFKAVSALPDGKNIFQLNLRTLEQSYFVKMNEEVEGYKVVKYEPNITTNAAGKKIDKSVLTLEKDGKPIELVKDRALTRHEAIALILFLIDRSKFTVQVDEEIEVKGRTYKIIDIRGGRVLIRDIQTGKNTPIKRLTEEERRTLRTSGKTGLLREPAGMKADASRMSATDMEKGRKPAAALPE